MSLREHLHESRGGWPRRPRRYSPFNRSHGLRRLPDDVISIAVTCSVLFHAVFAFGLIRVTQGPRWAPGAETSLVGLADLVASVPDQAPAAEVGSNRTIERGTPTPAPLPATRTASSPSRSPLPAPPATGAKEAVVEGSHPTSIPRTIVAVAPPQAYEPLPAMPEPATPREEGRVAMVSPPIVDLPLDSGWPEPSLLTVPGPASVLASPSSGVPAQVGAAARELTPALMVPGATSVDTFPAPARPAGAPVVAQERLEPPVVVAQPGPAAETARPARSASPLGMGSEPILVRLDGPRQRVTDQPSQMISGRLLGGAAERVAIYVNGQAIEMKPTQRAFEMSVPLQPGSNSVRAVAADAAGLEVDDTITVQYVTPPVTNGIVLASPDDGFALGREDPPVVVVEGEVQDKTIETVWIVANGRRVAATVRDGYFRQVVVVSEPILRLWAEAAVNGSPLQRSKIVTVRSDGTATTTGVLVVQWPLGMDPTDVEVSATWRSHADRLDIPAQTVSLPALAGTRKSSFSDVFYLKGVKPGVYTLTMRGRGPLPPSDVRSTLYLPGKAGFSECPLRPTRLGNGRTVLAKVLLPYGVLWSQDDWFSGVSESADTVTKFRIPEGVSWVERRADLP